MDDAAEVPVPGAGLTTGALARRLGVSPTTLRSWDRRYGLGPATRADGRHRRWTPDDVAVLEAMCRLTSSGVPPAEAARAARGATRPPTVPTPAPSSRSRAPGALPLGDVRAECRGLARAAVRLDAPAVEEQLDGVVAEYGLTVAWQDVMAPALHAVGRKWASSGDRYIEVEHLLSWHVATALRRHTPGWARPAPPWPGPSCSPAPPTNSTPFPWRHSTPRWANTASPPGCSAAPSPPTRSRPQYGAWARPRWCCGPSPGRPPACRSPGMSRASSGAYAAPAGRP